jgi:CspA family cold shock protein
MTVRGVVREWHGDEGWGIVDASEVPGGCWAGFAQVEIAGYRELRAGQDVALEWEPGPQDGFDYRATKVWPWGTEPVEKPRSGGGGGYESSLTLRFGR